MTACDCNVELASIARKKREKCRVKSKKFLKKHFTNEIYGAIIHFKLNIFNVLFNLKINFYSEIYISRQTNKNLIN